MSCIAVKPSTVAAEPLASTPRSAEVWISPDPARQFHSPYAYSPNPINSLDPDGNVAVFAQWSWTNVQVGGGSAATGVYADFGKNRGAGAYVSGGLSNMGYQVGTGPEIGFTWSEGGSADIAGLSVALSVSLGISATLYRTPDMEGQKGKFYGLSIGLGEAGGSAQATYTKLMTLETGGGWGSHPGSNPSIDIPTQKSDVSSVSAGRPVKW